MNQNVGEYDRVMRVAIGTALVVVGAAGYAGLLTLAVGPLPQGLTSLAVLLIGVILLVTGALRTCPIYSGLKRTTVRTSPGSEPNEDVSSETEA